MKQTLKMPFMTFLMLRCVECRKAQENICVFIFSSTTIVKCYCIVVYPFQVFNGKDLTEEMTKIQSVLSDDKNDWEHRVAAVSIKKITL